MSKAALRREMPRDFLIRLSGSGVDDGLLGLDQVDEAEQGQGPDEFDVVVRCDVRDPLHRAVLGDLDGRDLQRYSVLVGCQCEDVNAQCQVESKETLSLHLDRLWFRPGKPFVDLHRDERRAQSYKCHSCLSLGNRWSTSGRNYRIIKNDCQSRSLKERMLE